MSNVEFYYFCLRSVASRRVTWSPVQPNVGLRLFCTCSTNTYLRPLHMKFRLWHHLSSHFRAVCSLMANRLQNAQRKAQALNTHHRPRNSRSQSPRPRSSQKDMSPSPWGSSSISGNTSQASQPARLSTRSPPPDKDKELEDETDDDNGAVTVHDAWVLLVNTPTRLTILFKEYQPLFARQR